MSKHISILVLSKDRLSKRIEQLKVIYSRLCTAGIKINARKWSFGLKEIAYLGCVITWGGIKPDPKKVQGIMDLVRPTTMTESQALTSMFQYYRDIWTRWSHILSPMTEVERVPKSKLIIWNGVLEG